MKYSIYLVVMILFSTALGAQELVVDQKNKTFLPSNVTLKAGDTVRFKNSDPFAHNAYTDDESNEFDIGIQKPGLDSVVLIRSPGTIEVKCAIHPGMFLTIHAK
jgi:plastocyanin